ncbi:MAG TPA: phosphate signaling complex protein PhoU [Gammaproteobacteria bacterium]|nr:phosphate signaling complex protein PhoU [Gammaproteobacteria bacterium]
MERQDLASHISHAFNEDLMRIRQRTLDMGQLVEEQIGSAVQAVVSADRALARRVEYDDQRIDHLEVIIDGECSQVIVRRQPTAVDLRFVLSIIKIVADLERMGDEAEKVARMAAQLALLDRPQDNYRELSELGADVRDMARDAMTAFATYDARLAKDVLHRDQAVDRRYEAINSRSLAAMSTDPRNIRRLLYVLWLNRALERIGDHAKNIGEQVFYFVEGLDIRHPGTLAGDAGAV